MMILFLWLQLADKSVHRTCLFATEGRQIGPHDSTIVPWIADKSAKLIKHARAWMVDKTVSDYQPWTDEK